MRILEASEANEPLSSYLEGVENEPVIVTVNGKPVAALLSIGGTDLETASLSANPRFLALIERSRARLSKQGGLSSQEMRRRLDS